MRFYDVESIAISNIEEWRATIKFTIKFRDVVKTYTAFEGQTWGEWVAGHTDEFDIGGGHCIMNEIACADDIYRYIGKGSGGAVKTTDVIIADFAYTATAYYGA